MCEFEEEWLGRWSEDPNDPTTMVLITIDRISDKGLCYQRHRNYYLLENRCRKGVVGGVFVGGVCWWWLLVVAF